MPMSKALKVSIALTPELNDVVQDAVRSGLYASASEVVRAALRDWRSKAQQDRRIMAAAAAIEADEGYRDAEAFAQAHGLETVSGLGVSKSE